MARKWGYAIEAVAGTGVAQGGGGVDNLTREWF